MRVCSGTLINRCFTDMLTVVCSVARFYVMLSRANDLHRVEPTYWTYKKLKRRTASGWN